MVLKREEIIKICQNNLGVYKEKVKGIKYKLKGIFNSEMLLFISVVKHFGINLIIESGRASGQSTKIIAENFNNQQYKIYSIEYDRYNADVKRAFNRLKHYKNVRLLFGDSLKLIPKLIVEECCILIDGPKDFEAIKLAVNSLKNPLVKAVFIHDLDKDSPHRSWVEKIFYFYFFTDDYEFVKKFKNLDTSCWAEQNKLRECRTYGPFIKNSRKSESYAATLSVIFNSKKFFNRKVYDKYLNTIQDRNRMFKIKLSFKDWHRKILDIIQFPLFYIFYEKTIVHRKQLNYLNFIKEWLKEILTQIISISKT